MQQTIKTIDVTYNPVEEQVPILKPKRNYKKYLNLILSFFLICSFSLIAGVIGYEIYNYRTNYEAIGNYVQVESIDKSKFEIEQELLSQTPQKQKSLAEMQFGIENQSESEIFEDLEISDYLITTYSTVNEKGEFAIANSPLNANTLKLEYSTDTSLDIAKFSTNLNKTLTDKAYNVELGTSFIALENFEEILNNIKPVLDNKNVKLFIDVPAKWSDEYDYSLYARFDKSYSTELKLSLITTFADEIRIKAYDYTTPNSILPGPIAPNDWFEKVLQYYISKNIDRNKLTVIINTQGYSWEVREIANSGENNHILLDKQTLDTFNPEGLNLNADEMIENENFVISDEDIKVYPSNEKIKQQVEIVRIYGLNGVVLR